MNARFSVWCTINRVRSDEVRACVYMYVSVYTCICELQRGLGNPKIEEEKTHSQICRSRKSKRTTYRETTERLEYIKFTCSSAGSPRFVSSELVKLACLHKYGSPVNQRFFFQHFTYLFYLLTESSHNHLIFIKHTIM